MGGGVVKMEGLLRRKFEENTRDFEAVRFERLSSPVTKSRKKKGLKVKR